MGEINLSRKARADLAEIGEYGEAKFGRAAADAYQLDIGHAFDRLASFPRSGEPKPAWGKGLRCLVCNRHRIVYRVAGTKVEVLRILHHSRDVPRHVGA